MFGIFGLLVGLLFGTSKFALRNAVRAAAFGLVGYLVYELITGYTHAKEGKPAPAPLPDRPRQPQRQPDFESHEEAHAAATADRSPLTGGEKQGRTVRVEDGSGIGHATRVGRGVIRR